MINKGAKIKNAMAYASESGNKELVEYLIEKGANNWEESIYNACKSNNKEIIELLFSYGRCDVNKALELASYKGSIEFADFFISKGFYFK